MNQTENTVEVEVDTDVEHGQLRPLALGATALASAALAACGGGSDSPDANAPVVDASGLVVENTVVTRRDAWRFLTQATMGPTEEDIAYVRNNGYEAWLNKQFAIPASPTKHVDYYFTKVNVATDDRDWDIPRQSWWKGAIEGKDQLRQRVVFALSEIVVTSLKDATIGDWPLLMSGWMDLLHTKAFGGYRDLIAAVVRSPAMGVYLSFKGNIQPNMSTGQRPDQNFARELLQLFTVGLVKLDDFGRVQMNGSSAIANSTTASTDVKVLSHVFVGLSLDGTYTPKNATAAVDIDYSGWPYSERHNMALARPMKVFPNRHCTAAMVRESMGLAAGAPLMLLGKELVFDDTDVNVTIANALKIILDNANVAPFIARQMIQRMVTSNPTSGYVFRVAQAFRNSDYSIKSLVRAILLDNEARYVSTANDYGKIREPLLRVTHLLRALNPKLSNPDYSVFPWAPTTATFDTGIPAIALAQAPFTAVNVFNFFSPNYIAVGNQTGALGKFVPELQIASETTVASYVNAIQDILTNGFFTGNPRMIPAVTTIASQTTTTNMVAKLDELMMGQSMSTALKSYIIATLDSAEGVALSADKRARLAVLMLMSSPEYIVQK